MQPLSNTLGLFLSVKAGKILQRSFLAFLLCTLVSHAQAETRVFDINIKNGVIPSTDRLMRVQKDDQVTLRIESDLDGEFHIHAYQIDLPIKAGAKTIHSFKAFATGRYRVEWHPEIKRGKSSHHADSLAHFEVFPK
jgi:hypothetical protein